MCRNMVSGKLFREDDSNGNSRGFNTTKRLITITLKQNLSCVLLLSASVILLGLINGVAYTEALRRLTQAVWEREWGGFVHAMCGFGAVILCSLALNIGKRRSAFLLKKKLTFACEDAVYKSFSGKEYWMDIQEETVLGHIRKNVPDTMGDIVEQGNQYPHSLCHYPCWLPVWSGPERPCNGVFHCGERKL
ncbi:MAG TPA: hypothetical protein H9744_04325 [Candidatus Eisenbergiella stercoravium]|nr:hypothetical protein [Candidatus Eisenbergiella stercoravium]